MWGVRKTYIVTCFKRKYSLIYFKAGHVLIMKLYQDQLAWILKVPGDHNVQDLDQRVEASLQYYNHTKIRRVLRH